MNDRPSGSQPQPVHRALAVLVTLPLLLLLAGSAWAAAPAEEEEEASPFGNLMWRNIGPVNMSGRVADVEGVPGDPRIVYVGSASGGVWKSENGGLTFSPIFDEQPIASIGDLALAPSNPQVIYVGTGEGNPRNSVSFGNGVYKSLDGGTTWIHLGLEESRHITRVLVHPNDPDTVFVGALGSIFGPNEERGVFRSTDGGAHWEKVLYRDPQHGVADMDMDPNNPNVLFAALWHFDRKPWTHTSGSEDGGVFRSLDGGTTWEKITEGLPKLMGRIGVKIAPSNGKVVYVIAESDEGTLFRSDDRGATFRKVSDDVQIVSRGLYYTDMRVDPVDENRIYAVSSRLFRSIDGGRTFERIARNVHVDFHALWIDPQDPARLWQGQDGGVAVSYDRATTWEPIRNLPIAQFYQIFYDQREPFYYVGGGLQDNGTWFGPSRTREPAGILADDWRMMSFGDAYFVVPHPEQEDLFLSESQAGGIVRTDMRTRQQLDVNPQARRNDGGPAGDLTYRFNWNAPIIASPHDPNTVYFAGNVVWKTSDFGTTWEQISPDLTTDDESKQGEAGGPVWYENTTAEYHCTIISLAESPVQAGVLWVGTDDGNLQLSRDGGETWTNVIGNVPGLPAFSPVSHLEPSRTAAGTAYAAFDRHMFDDFAPHIFQTTDFGATWTRRSEDLPDQAWVWVVREDPKNPQLLYAGTELGLYASWNAGRSWRPLSLENLPVVSVHDILIHPRDNDLLLGTHGRAIWIFDDATPIQQMSEAVKEAPAHLFPTRPVLRYPIRFTRYGLGDKAHRAPNPPTGALLTYHLASSLEEEEDGAMAEEEATAKPGAERMREELPESEHGRTDGGTDMDEEKEARIELEILDASGTVVRTIEAKELPKKAGLNRVAWDLRHDPPRSRDDEEEGGRSEFFGPRGGPYVLPGTYTARLTVDGTPYETPVDVRIDPLVDLPAADVQAQHTMTMDLADRISNANDALRGLDVLEAQLADRRAVQKRLQQELPDDLETLWKELEESIDEMLKRFVRSDDKPFWSQGPRFADQLENLLFEVDGGFAAPTAAHRAFYDELMGEYRENMGDYNTLLREQLPAFNEQLDAAGIPPLALPPVIELE